MAQTHAAKAENKAPPEPTITFSASITDRELVVITRVRERYNIDRSSAIRLIINEYERMSQARQANK